MARSGAFQDFTAGLSDTGSPGTRLTIADLSPGISNVHLIGVVVAKEDVRGIPSKKDPGTERFLINFTLRDSPVDLINVTWWGDEQYIQETASLFHYGDVVDISHVAVQSKPLDGSEEKFRPPTLSPYRLSGRESRSTVKHYSGWDLESYKNLLHVPAKASTDIYTIADILANREALHKELVNMLAVVQHVGSVRDVTAKTGKHMKRCEVKLLDETGSNFHLVLWNEEFVNLALTWAPKDTVIYASDVRVTHDDFKKTMIATATSKTILTVNPATKEAQNLYIYAQTHQTPEDDNTEQTNTGVDLASINTIYTVQETKDLMKPDSTGGRTEHVIVYGFLTSFSLSSESLISTRCASCRFRVDPASCVCSNQNCPRGFSGQAETIAVFDMVLSVSDHTGTLPTCRLSGQAAEEMLGCTVDEFSGFDDARKNEIEEKYVLEKCKFYMKITVPDLERPNDGGVRVLKCTLADLREAVKYLQA